MHPHRRGLEHQLDLSGQVHQIIQAHKGDVGTEAGGEDTEILYLRMGFLGMLCHCHQAVAAVFQGEEFAFQGAFAVSGEVKAVHGGAEKLHFLCNGGLDGVQAVAAQTMNGQNNTVDTKIRRVDLDGDGQFSFLKHKFLFHINHLSLS